MGNIFENLEKEDNIEGLLYEESFGQVYYLIKVEDEMFSGGCKKVLSNVSRKFKFFFEEDQFICTKRVEQKVQFQSLKNLNIRNRVWYVKKYLICVQLMESEQVVEMRLLKRYL